MVRMKESLVTDSSVEPVSLADMKEFGKIDLTDEETTISSFIKSARVKIEEYCGIAMITKTYDFYFDEADDLIKLPFPPLQSVTTFVYNDLDYSETEITSTKYKVFSFTRRKGEVCKLPEKTYVDESIPSYNAFRIRSVHGFGDAASDVPEDLKTAIKLTALHWHENRESQELPPEAMNIARNYKVFKV